MNKLDLKEKLESKFKEIVLFLGIIRSVFLIELKKYGDFIINMVLGNLNINLMELVN